MKDASKILSSAALLASALLLVWGCTSEPGGDRCPPEMTWDADLERCIDAAPELDAGDEGDSGGENGDDGGNDNGGNDNGDNENNSTDDAGTGDVHDADDTTGTQDATDGGEQAPCDGVECGANASCSGGECFCDDGYDGDPDQECFPIESCEEDCSQGATCLEGECICDPGFVAVSDGCELEEVSDPASRSQAEVCERWTQNPFSYSTEQWAEEPQNECDWGWLNEEYHLEAIRETTRYRWLVGLPAVTTSESARELTQACATTLAAEDTMTHDIEEDFACYTEEAASGASSSNLVSGMGNAAGSLKVYIEDWNVPSLGHRRWVFNPGMGQTAFGARGTYGCMYSFDNSGSASPEFTAYPAEGYFPEDALHGKWSLAGSGLSLSDNTEISVENLEQSSSVSIHDFAYHPTGYYRPPMVSWRLTAPAEIGETHEITIADAYGEGDDLVYEVTLIDCE